MCQTPSDCIGPAQPHGWNLWSCISYLKATAATRAAITTSTTASSVLYSVHIRERAVISVWLVQVEYFVLSILLSLSLCSSCPPPNPSPSLSWNTHTHIHTLTNKPILLFSRNPNWCTHTHRPTHIHTDPHTCQPNCDGVPWNQWGTSRRTGCCVLSWWWQWRCWHPWAQRHHGRAGSRPCTCHDGGRTSPSDSQAHDTLNAGFGFCVCFYSVTFVFSCLCFPLLFCALLLSVCARACVRVCVCRCICVCVEIPLTLKMGQGSWNW